MFQFETFNALIAEFEAVVNEHAAFLAQTNTDVRNFKSGGFDLEARRQEVAKGFFHGEHADNGAFAAHEVRVLNRLRSEVATELFEVQGVLFEFQNFAHHSQNRRKGVEGDLAKITARHTEWLNKKVANWNQTVDDFTAEPAA